MWHLRIMIYSCPKFHSMSFGFTKTFDEQGGTWSMFGSCWQTLPTISKHFAGALHLWRIQHIRWINTAHAHCWGSWQYEQNALLNNFSAVCRSFWLHIQMIMRQHDGYIRSFISWLNIQGSVLYPPLASLATWKKNKYKSHLRNMALTIWLK